MNTLTKIRFVLVFAVITTALTGLAGINAFGQSSESQRAVLIERFNLHKSNNYQAAYEAASEYLQRYGGDNTEDVNYLKQWVAAYEKISGKTNRNKLTTMPVGQNLDNSEADSKKNRPSLAETLEWLRENLDIYGSAVFDVVYFSEENNRKGKLSLYPLTIFTNKLTVSEQCKIVIGEEFKNKQGKAGGEKWSGQSSSGEITIALSTIDASRIRAVNERFTMLPDWHKVEPFVFKNQNSIKKNTHPAKGWFVRLTTLNNRELINQTNSVYTFLKKDENTNNLFEKLKEVRIMFNDEDIAERAAAALGHAVNICQETRKNSPF